MNKVILIYNSGETIPFLIISCDSYDYNENGFNIERDSNKWFLPIDWDYFKCIEIGKNGEQIVNLFKNFQEEINKYK